MPKNVRKKFRTVRPDPGTPVDALVLTDDITLRLGKLASVAGMVKQLAEGMDGENLVTSGVELLADMVMKELDQISEQVGQLYHALEPAGGVR